MRVKADKEILVMFHVRLYRKSLLYFMLDYITEKQFLTGETAMLIEHYVYTPITVYVMKLSNPPNWGKTRKFFLSNKIFLTCLITQSSNY